MIKVLLAEKHAVMELFLDLLHSQETGELKEQISQHEILNLLQLVKPPADDAKVPAKLYVHWDSIVRYGISFVLISTCCIVYLSGRLSDLIYYSVYSLYLCITFLGLIFFTEFNKVNI